MFCEIRGTSDPVKVPVVLLYGAISACAHQRDRPICSPRRVGNDMRG